MKNNSLKIKQNRDKTFTCEWDKNDPEWKWLNDLTSKGIQIIMEQAIQYDKETRNGTIRNS